MPLNVENIKNTSQRPFIIKKLFLSFLVLLLVFFFLKDFHYGSLKGISHKLVVELTVKMPYDDIFDLFYDIGGSYNPKNLVSANVKGSLEFQVIHFEIPYDGNIRGFRLDPGTRPATIEISGIRIIGVLSEKTWKPSKVFKLFETQSDIAEFRLNDKSVLIRSTGEDPVLVTRYDLTKSLMELSSRSLGIFLSLLLSFLVSVAFFLLIHYTSGYYGKIYSNYLPGHTKFNLGFASCFILVIFLPLLSKFIEIDPMANVNKEKRILSEKPSFSFSRIFQYPKEYSNYFKDNFGFRNLLVSINSEIKVKYLNSSTLPKKVVIGKEGWLYYIKDECLSNARQDDLFTNHDLARVKKILEDRGKWLHLRGIDYYFFIPPEKSTIYPEFTPPYIKLKNKISRFDQIVAVMKDNPYVHVLDIRDFYFEKKKKIDLYYKTDTHWNLYGSFLGYTELLKMIIKDHPNIKFYKPSEFRVRHNKILQGDLAQMLAVDDNFGSEIFLIHKNPLKAYETTVVEYPGGKVYDNKTIVKEQDDKSLPSVVVIRDSYMNFMITNLSEHFRRSVYVWTPEFNTDIIDYEKPQLVIQEMLETFLGFILVGNPPALKKELAAHPELK
jgi:hypothetical protein